MFKTQNSITIYTCLMSFVYLDKYYIVLGVFPKPLNRGICLGQAITLEEIIK